MSSTFLCRACVVTPRLVRAMVYLRRFELEAVRQEELDDLLGISLEHHLVAAALPLHPLRLATQKMLLVGRLEFDLAGGRELEALLGAALRLHLGHFHFPSIS